MSTTQDRLAFPVPDGAGQIGREGMTLRQWYAGMALQGILSHSGVAAFPHENLAHISFNIADAMLYHFTKS